VEIDDGDTIEIHGNGPFIESPLLTGRSVIVRAAQGYRPVIQMSPLVSGNLITSRATLVLEGLELDGWTFPATSERYRQVVRSENGALLMAGCLIRARGPAHTISVSRPMVCEIRNCAVVAPNWSAFIMTVPARAMVRFEGNVWLRGKPTFELVPHEPQQVAIEIRRNTWLFGVPDGPALEWRFYSSDMAVATQAIRVEATENLWVGAEVRFLLNQWTSTPGPATETEALFKQLVRWHERRNLYSPDKEWLRMAHKFAPVKWPGAVKTLADWQAFWDQKDSTEAIEQEPRFLGERLPERLHKAYESIRLDELALHSDSPGKGLGADIRQVGPGLAYERWKKSSQYELWRKRIGEVLRR
jgi:hypothetical protein